MRLRMSALPDLKGRAPATFPVEPGFSFHSETNMDLMQRPIGALADAMEKLDLPLRSIENEWGPGQLECTFAPRDALEPPTISCYSDTATQQICRRIGLISRPSVPTGLNSRLLFERVAPAPVGGRRG